MEIQNKKEPICKEPWKRLYILRRGILPCCHGYRPIAEMKDYKKAWNNKEMQEIRSYLARGKFSNYCLTSESCPIVQRHYSKIEKKNKKLAISKLMESPKYVKHYLKHKFLSIFGK